MAPHKLKRYSISVEGWDPAYVYEAKNASAARWMAYRAFTDAVGRIDFLVFLRKTTTLHLGPVNHDGQVILRY